MKSRPLISTIIPVYNCERYLAEAIESVLNQSYFPHEVIVIDDGSEDGSEQVARQFGSLVRYSRQPHSGIGAARNHAARLAQGTFLALLDADDVWVEDKSARQMAAFDADPTLHIVAGHVRHFHSPELDQSIVKRTYCPPNLMPGYMVGALIRRDFFEGVGPFETNWHIGETMSWYMRATEMGLRLLTLPDVVIWRRLHEANQTIRNRQRLAEYAQILKASLDRRRANPTA
jgi:glycosyltransferase involved in cell wall biosynthesis